MYTEDGGAKWSFLPVPKGASVLSFGGYRYGARRSRPFFVPVDQKTSDPVPVVEQAGGRGTFSLDSFSCPAAGLCISLGAYPTPGNCANTFTVIGDQLWWLTSAVAHGTMTPTAAYGRPVASLVRA